MTRAFKTFLLWLLLAALPLQGLAAAVQASCGPMRHHAPSEKVATAHSHHHGGRGDAGSMNASAADHDAIHAGDSADATHKHSTCSACAVCCAGAAAPPSTSLSTPGHGKSLPVFIAPSPLAVAFIQAGPERPPKRMTS